MTQPRHSDTIKSTQVTPLPVTNLWVTRSLPPHQRATPAASSLSSTAASWPYLPSPPAVARSSRSLASRMSSHLRRPGPCLSSSRAPFHSPQIQNHLATLRPSAQDPVVYPPSHRQ